MLSRMTFGQTPSSTTHTASGVMQRIMVGDKLSPGEVVRAVQYAVTGL